MEGMTLFKKKLKLPPIGLRIIKSSVAVFLCYIIDYLRKGSGIVFYSQLAALWCMQDYISESKDRARQRLAGTTIGAIYGLIVLVLITRRKLMIGGLPEAVLIAVFIIPIIYTAVVSKRQNAAYFSCVVFLSIVVNHAKDVNPYLFVLNRVLDTIIGIVIGVCVNCFELPGKKKNKDVLFLSGLDDTLLNSNNNLSAYSRVELNRMIDAGLVFTVSTRRTPASLMEPMKDIKLKLPVVVMDGAALYNINEKRFEKVYVISKRECANVISFFENAGVSYFANVIVDDTVLIYYSDSDNAVYNTIVDRLRKSPYRNYIKRPVPAEENAAYFMVADETEKVEALYQEMERQGLLSRLRVTVYESSEYEGCSYLRIYNHNVSRENMLEYLLNQLSVKKVTSFGTIPGKYTHLIAPGDSNAVVRTIKREFERG